jgi:hypothetical protein
MTSPETPDTALVIDIAQRVGDVILKIYQQDTFGKSSIRNQNSIVTG